MGHVDENGYHPSGPPAKGPQAAFPGAPDPPQTFKDAQALAEQIAATLKAEGAPILGAAIQDAGYKAAFAIQLPNGQRTAFRVPIDNLRIESVREMVWAYL